MHSSEDINEEILNELKSVIERHIKSVIVQEIKVVDAFMNVPASFFFTSQIKEGIDFIHFDTLIWKVQAIDIKKKTISIVVEIEILMSLWKKTID